MNPHQPQSNQLPMKTVLALLGILISAIMSGLNSRVGSLGLVDIRGAWGLALDASTWLSTAYTVGELIAMPFATWFAITLSVRRFHFYMVLCSAAIALILPFIQDLNLMIGLRFIQGVSSGALIPILMMMALKTLPPHIRLHGLALYALTATFAPNLAIWITAFWTDSINDWRWVYWQILPMCFISLTLVGMTLPKEKVLLGRFKEGNWFGMCFGMIALILIGISLSQGVRLDWFNSPLICISLGCGLAFLGIYLLSEWYHPTPFIKLQLLSRRNLWLGSVIFMALLTILLSGSLLPASYLGMIQGFKVQQIAPIGLYIALPQLILGSIVAIFLYQKWVNAKVVLCIGLAVIAISCFLSAQLTIQWHTNQFINATLLQAVGQPMVVVPLLFLMTSVVAPMEGPYFSGTINALRVLGTLFGSAVVGQLLVVRGRYHSQVLLDQAMQNDNLHFIESTNINAVIAQQSHILSVADSYRVLGVFAIIVIFLVLKMFYIPAPNTQAAPATNNLQPKHG
ncbi:MFS transporter [Psychromonas aquatilis]|uniref:MFS transporter n=1 Tax=Psychromonas aquatilis TaxID=2005072 RepID=A0ABU9GS26_9GAMM